MFTPVDTRNPDAVEREVQTAHQLIFPQSDPVFVSRAFAWVKDCFTGRHPEYHASDARYHDLEHTMQGTLCMARLLQGMHEAGARPATTQSMFELGIVAMLFHDTGYLKKRDDPEGTGAKYTLTHVTRSVQFAGAFLERKGFKVDDVLAVQHMIRCTGVNADLSRIPFQSELERVVGFALGTSDLLGQMAAPDYVDKLPILFGEFEESARFYEGKMTGVDTFSGPDELIRKTPDFWVTYVLPKIQKDFCGVHRFLNRPLPHGPNEYIEKVEANISRIRKALGTQAAA